MLGVQDDMKCKSPIRLSKRKLGHYLVSVGGNNGRWDN